jgi:hypothetical protein
MDAKSELLVAIAALPAGDRRLPRLAAIVANKREEERVISMRLLRPGEAALALNMSRTSLWRLTREKRIPVVETRRGAFRYSEEALRLFVEGHK